MTIEELKSKDLIIFEGIVGSKAYGTATPTSDIDIKGVFMMPLDSILNFDYIEQVSDSKQDTTYYELKRFLQLVQTNNPNILELLNLPEDCIIQKHPIFDMILQHKEKFISKVCKNSFGGYAISQIQKARGLNKKITAPIEEKRKNVLDFCYVPFEQGSIPVKEYLKINDMDQKYCGLVAIDHMRFTYAVFYDKNSELIDRGINVPRSYTPYKGIVQDLEKSNEVCLSDIPKSASRSFILQFNSDGYSTSCRKYKEYWDWVEKRNPHRFLDNMLHGKGYDGKNCAHALRLLEMAIEIANGKGILVKRPNRDELLSIRKGEYNYDTLLEKIEKLKIQMDLAFDNSSLPNDVDKEFVNNLLLQIRKKRYML